MIASSRCPAPWTPSAYWRWRVSRSVPRSSPARPITPFIGVRISWLIVARNDDLARERLERRVPGRGELALGTPLALQRSHRAQEGERQQDAQTDHLGDGVPRLTRLRIQQRHHGRDEERHHGEGAAPRRCRWLVRRPPPSTVRSTGTNSARAISALPTSQPDASTVAAVWWFSAAGSRRRRPASRRRRRSAGRSSRTGTAGRGAPGSTSASSTVSRSG